VKGGLPAERSWAFTDRDELVGALEDFLLPGDVVLLKGSRGMAMEAVASALGFVEE
jgi:UDP-N-acetylmuramoyl-tripeptide--D-alanyl-D-alanine ligase